MRYVRQLCDVDRLKEKSVLVVGAGALGCASIPYLLGAGVGKVTLMDDDVVELTNLHRQVLYDETQIGLPKVKAAWQKLARLNTEVQFIPIQARFSTLDQAYDLVLDATDRFSSKLLIDEACFARQIPWIYASIDRFSGQAAFFHKTRLTDLFPGPLDDSLCQTCAVGGMIGPLAGILGSIQALEALKILEGASVESKLIRIDALSWKMESFSFTPQRMKHLPELLIDIRRPEEIKQRIGELEIPYPEILHADLPRDRKLVLICAAGVRSQAAAKCLRAKGYDAHSLVGGVS